MPATSVTSSMTVIKLNTAVVVTVSQAAVLAAVSEATIRREIAAGRLQARRIGRCVRVTRAEFDRRVRGEDDAEKA